MTHDHNIMQQLFYLPLSGNFWDGKGSTLRGRWVWSCSCGSREASLDYRKLLRTVLLGLLEPDIEGSLIMCNQFIRVLVLLFATNFDSKPAEQRYSRPQSGRLGHHVLGPQSGLTFAPKANQLEGVFASQMDVERSLHTRLTAATTPRRVEATTLGGIGWRF